MVLEPSTTVAAPASPGALLPVAPWPPIRLLRLPVRLLRYEQALAEHGPAARQRCCGPTLPPGHVRFPTLNA